MYSARQEVVPALPLLLALFLLVVVVVAVVVVVVELVVVEVLLLLPALSMVVVVVAHDAYPTRMNYPCCVGTRNPVSVFSPPYNKRSYVYCAFKRKRLRLRVCVYTTPISPVGEMVVKEKRGQVGPARA